MPKYFITTIIIIIVVVAFAVLNYAIVPVNFGFRKLEVSLALLIFVVFAFGALVSFFVSLPESLRLNKENKRKDIEIEQLKSEIADLKKTDKTRITPGE